MYVADTVRIGVTDINKTGSPICRELAMIRSKKRRRRNREMIQGSL